MSETRKRNRLPRTRGVRRPGSEERVRWKTGADLQNGWWGRHGTLHLTDERLVFVPTPLDRLLGGRAHEMHLDRVAQFERWPEAPGDPPRGGRRPRMLVHTEECVYQFVLPDLDGWLDAVEKVYVLRAKRGDAYRPTFRRAESDNLMLADD